MMTEEEKASFAKMRRERVIRVGKMLHGPRFGKDLAAGMGASQQLVSAIVSGQRGVTDDFERKLAAYIDRRQVEVVTEMVNWARESNGLKSSLGEIVTVTTSTSVPVVKAVEPDGPAPKKRAMVMPSLGKTRRLPDPAPEPELDDDGPDFVP